MTDPQELNGRKDSHQPTYRQMARYALEGIVLTVAVSPLLYLRWMRRSPFEWLSERSFHNFGWFVFAMGVVFVLVRIGSHADEA